MLVTHQRSLFWCTTVLSNLSVGSPILVTKNPNPTNEEVDSTHAKYIEALMNLFETHKTRFEPKATLEIR